MWEWSPGQHEVDRRETHVEVVVHLREGRVESIPDLLALEGPRRGVNGDFSDDLRDVKGTLGLLKGGRVRDELVDLIGDQANIRAKGDGSETKFDKLGAIRSASELHGIVLVRVALTLFCSINFEFGQS